MYDTLENDLKKPLYPGCKKSLALLLAVLSLVNVKTKYRWSDKSFTSLLNAGYASRGKHVAKKLL